LEQYGLNYTTSADCKQIKVILHNERFLNGGGWGSSPKAFLVDEMVLTGTSRVLDQKVGFENTGANVEYFAYDMSGAYAPLAPGFGDDFSGVEETVAANAPYYVAAAEGIAVYNVGEGASLAVYDAMGVLVASQSEYLAGTPVVLPRKGMYVCVVTDAVKAHTLKVVY
ncbi:MAG: hypothetical protein K2F79_01215, partial [Muribaculaceae bacterium]|nr:hypothetical protein [Muribaculaceae bacterium]